MVVVGMVFPNVVSIRPEVVVNHIQKHGEPVSMCAVDQPSEVVGSAVDSGGGIPGYAVVPPIPLTRKICYRHQFDGVDPQIGKILQLVFNCCEIIGWAECANMNLIKN